MKKIILITISSLLLAGCDGPPSADYLKNKIENCHYYGMKAVPVYAGIIVNDIACEPLLDKDGYAK